MQIRFLDIELKLKAHLKHSSMWSMNFVISSNSQEESNENNSFFVGIYVQFDIECLLAYQKPETSS